MQAVLGGWRRHSAWACEIWKSHEFVYGSKGSKVYSLEQSTVFVRSWTVFVVTTDTSNKGWGALCEGKPTFNLWTEEESVVSYINHQGGLVSKGLLVWAQSNLRSLKAMHVLGKMNHGADMLSRNNVSSEEWTLHPLSVQKICEVFGKARVDLFASVDNSHCPIFFTKSTYALAHEWPSLPLYAFPPIALLPQVLRRVRSNSTSLFK